jgi:hypothetical protein
MYQSPRSYQKAFSALHFDADGVYVNDPSNARLAALKQTDDPTNRFRSNQNIAPAGKARRVGPERSS